MIINVNGTTLFYRKSGSGPPLVLMHGNGEDHSIFDELAAKLEPHFTLYALDSRNHGRSAKTDTYAYGVMAEDVFALIRALTLAPAGIVGFSDGAIVGLLLAMAHPEVVAKMALLGVNLKPDDFTEEAYAFVRQSFEETGDPLFGLMLEQPDISLDDVRGVAVPTLLIAGEHDIYKPELFDNLLHAFPDAKLTIMPEHGHDTYIVHQDLLYPDLLAFFS